MKPSAVDPASKGFAKARVLLCEDDGKLRRLLAEALRQEGFAITMADDGAAAVWEFTESENPCKEFDVVIMDYSLRGGMTGGETVNAIRLLCPDQPVVFLSGHDLPADITDREIVLKKPASVSDILSAIKEATERRAK